MLKYMLESVISNNYILFGDQVVQHIVGITMDTIYAISLFVPDLFCISIRENLFQRFLHEKK